MWIELRCWDGWGALTHAFNHLVHHIYTESMDYPSPHESLFSPTPIPDIYNRQFGEHSAWYEQVYAALGDLCCHIDGARFAIRGAGGLAGDVFYGLLAEPFALRDGDANCGV